MDKSTVAEKKNVNTEKNQFRNIGKSEPEWIYRLRKQGWEFYHDSPLPKRSNHLWRYSDPAIFDPQIAGASKNFSKEFPIDFSGTIVENPELQNKGIIFKDLFSALNENCNLVEKYFGDIVNIDFGKFEALNHAIWNTGMFLYIPDNLTIEDPIHIKYRPTAEANFRRLLVVTGKNVDVTIIDDYKSGSENALINSVFEIFADDNSRIKLLNLNRLSGNEKAYITGRARIGANCTIESVYACFGGKNTKVNTGVILNGQGSTSKMTGLIFGDKARTSDYHTKHHHTAGDSYSNLNFKVVAKDGAQSAYTGLIRIEKDATNCEAYQTNNNLILDKGAKAESIPELEILTDQVSCSHGATMGPVDQEMLFFMKSRGLSEPDAIELIIGGFFESAMVEMPKEFKNILKDELSSKLRAK